MAEQNKNLAIYNEARAVEKEALKVIGAGRLKGMSDINPMWRIKMLTKLFGVCGIGWKYTITKQWLETAGNETKGFCNIDLFIKVDGEWSEAIPGTGGTSFISVESTRLYVNDEVYKMALTDAISVATKALGFGADVYYAAGAHYDIKYDYNEQQANGCIKPQSKPQAATQQPKASTQVSQQDYANKLAIIKAAKDAKVLYQMKDECERIDARLHSAMYDRFVEIIQGTTKKDDLSAIKEYCIGFDNKLRDVMLDKFNDFNTAAS